MRRAAVVVLLTVGACGDDTPLADLFKSESPYEEYLGTLERGGLVQTALGRDWVRAGAQALSRPASARLPFRETGYFPPDKPAAVAYRFDLRRGRTLTIDLHFESATPARIFADLFVQRDSSPPERVASLTPEDSSLVYDVRRDGTYLLRIQPELLRGGRWTVVERTLASLGFPVPGRGLETVRSGFGAERDAGRRSHQGLDIFAPRGTPVIAIVDGYARAATNELGGNVIWLSDARRGRTLYYAHLDRWAVDGGANVRVGDTVGFIGKTGNARTTPPHLHFGIYDGGAVDPQPFFAPDDPVPPAVDLPGASWHEWVRVTPTSTLLRNGAHRGADTLGRLQRGELGRLSAASHRVLRVTLPDESTGYIDRGAVTRADRPLFRVRLDSGTVLRESPAGAAPAVERLTAEVMADVLGRFGEYSLVRVTDAGTGWVATHMIGLPPNRNQRYE